MLFQVNENGSEECKTLLCGHQSDEVGAIKCSLDSVFSGCITPIIEDGYLLIRKSTVDKGTVLGCTFRHGGLPEQACEPEGVLSRPGLTTVSSLPSSFAHGVAPPTPTVKRRRRG